MKFDINQLPDDAVRMTKAYNGGLLPSDIVKIDLSDQLDGLNIEIDLPEPLNEDRSFNLFYGGVLLHKDVSYIVNEDKVLLLLDDPPKSGESLEVQYVVSVTASGIPIGTIHAGRGPDADVGYIKLAEGVLTYWPIAGFEGKGITDLVTRCYVGDADNDTALAYFKCNVDGTVRSTAGGVFRASE